MNLKVISVDRLFIVFVLQWKISYQAILWCAFTFKLARALIALFNGTYLPIKLHIFRYILISFLWYTLFSFKIDFLAYLHVVKFSLRTSSISSEKGYIVHRLWNIGQKLPCQWEETLVPGNCWTFHHHWIYVFVLDATWALSIPADFWRGLRFTG